MHSISALAHRTTPNHNVIVLGAMIGLALPFFTYRQTLSFISKGVAKTNGFSIHQHHAMVIGAFVLVVIFSSVLGAIISDQVFQRCCPCLHYI